MDIKRSALLSAGILVSLAAASAAGSANDAAPLRLQNERMTRLAELAAGQKFYLLLQPSSRTLRLMYQGVVLNEYPVLAMELGRREVLFVDRDLPPDWHETIWDDAKLEPLRVIARKVIVPPDPRSASAVEEEAVIPPTPEEAVPAPGRYKIRYRDARVLEIVGDHPGGGQQGVWGRSLDAVGNKVADLRDALSLSEPDAMRLKLVLKDEQARMLYRALPEGSRFMIVAESP